MAKKINLNTAIIPPYQVYDNDKNLTGDSVVIVECILNKMNYNLHLKVYSWKRAQEQVFNQEDDGFFIASKNDKRNKHAKISKELISSSWNWYTLKGSKKEINSLAFKKKAKVATIAGTNMNSFLSKNYKNIITAKKPERLIKLLRGKRVDAILSTIPIFESGLKVLDISKNEFNKNIQREMSLGVYFSHKFLSKNPEFMKEFNSQISSCKNNQKHH
jgi:ABC-type amino acid transport substrate-binding protein